MRILSKGKKVTAYGLGGKVQVVRNEKVYLITFYFFSGANIQTVG